MARFDGLDALRIRVLLEYSVDLNVQRVAEKFGILDGDLVDMLSEPLMLEAFAELEADRATRLMLSGDQIVMEVWRGAQTAVAMGAFAGAASMYKLLGEHFGLWGKGLLSAGAGRSDTRVQTQVNVSFGRNATDPTIEQVVLSERNGQLERSAEIDSQAAALPGRSDQARVLLGPVPAKEGRTSPRRSR